MGSSKSSPVVESESDDTRRRAKVYILKTTIGLGGPMTLVNHWALVFKFDSGRYPWVIIEGTEKNGTLQANYRSQSSKPSGTLIDPKGVGGFFTFLEATLTLNVKQFITSLVVPEYVCMSPSEIRQFALNHPLNGNKYVFGICDCQTWVANATNRLESV